MGAALCLAVLLVVLLVWINPASRGALDRVSFRIAAYVVFCKSVEIQLVLTESIDAIIMINSLFFAIASAVGGMLTAPGFSCGFSIFILQVRSIH